MFYTRQGPKSQNHKFSLATEEHHFKYPSSGPKFQVKIILRCTAHCKPLYRVPPTLSWRADTAYWSLAQRRKESHRHCIKGSKNANRKASMVHQNMPAKWSTCRAANTCAQHTYSSFSPLYGVLLNTPVPHSSLKESFPAFWKRCILSVGKKS